MKWTTSQIHDMTGILAVVTGANSGIGFVTARVLAEKGARVILACRSAERANAARDRILAAAPAANVEVRLLDLASLEAIRTFADGILESETSIDLLINNAGIMMPPRRTETTDGFEMQIGVNHLGHFALTARLLPLLNNAPAARVVTVSSHAHYKTRMDLDDLNYERRRYWRIGSYGQSKLANLLFTFELDRRLKAAGARTVAVAAHPGWTATDLQRNIPGGSIFNTLLAMNVEQGALPTLRAAVDPDVRGGEYYGPKSLTGTHGYPDKVGCSNAASDPVKAARLWTVSERLTGEHMAFANGD